MKVMEDDNIFDEDDALDFVIYEETENEVAKSNKSSGCLSSVVVFLTIPSSLLYYVLTV